MVRAEHFEEEKENAGDGEEEEEEKWQIHKGSVSRIAKQARHCCSLR